MPASTGALLCALGAQAWVASPRGYGLPDWVRKRCHGLPGELHSLESVQAAVEGADVLYTDTWIFMGREAEARRRIFADFRIDPALLAAAPDAIVLHCLPQNQPVEDCWPTG